MRYRRLNTDFVSTDPFTGLYLAAFGSHGPEVLQLSREPDPHDVSFKHSAAALAAAAVPDAVASAAAASADAAVAAISPLWSTCILSSPDATGIAAVNRAQTATP